VRLWPLPIRLLRGILKLGLLGRFSVLSAAAMLVLGLALAQTLSGQIRTRAIENAEQASLLITRFGIQPQLSQVDLTQPLAPEVVTALDDQLRSGYMSAPVATTIQVWNRRGRVEYSNRHALIGKVARGGDGARVTEALRGRTNSVIDDGADVGMNEDSQVIEAYVPLDINRDGAAEGVFEIHLDYKPVAATIAHDKRRLYVILAGGLLLLYAALFRIVAAASQRLRRQAAENEYRARHDLLTGLPNRSTFHTRVEAAIGRAHANDSPAAVMVIDLDRFKEVNDTLGHHVGDLLLREVGTRIGAILRASDTLGRLGGDEFAALLGEIESPDAALAVAGRIAHALEQPFTITGCTVHIEASIGIALAPDHADDVGELMQHADVAMYVAKGSPTRCEIYSSEQEAPSSGHIVALGELRRALERNELVVYYQPEADIQSGGVVGVEALVRWIHPDRGLVPPLDFIPLAERTGLIRPLTAFVLETALAQCRTWLDEGHDLTVAVNLSVRNLLDEALPQSVAMLLERHGVEARRLKLEITEGTIMADPRRAMKVLSELHDMGVGLSIDDFGTGYSSLSYLKGLPVSELKIDRTFVNDMTGTDGDALIVRSTIDLARNLGLRVVAEGVETEAIWRQLGLLGCDIGQGYYLSRPVPADELTTWLEDARRQDVPWSPPNFMETRSEIEETP
jgi:diguanylate cyclase (GGDEF)-like protein